MDWARIFNDLVQAETESAVTRCLQRQGLLGDESLWVPLGENESNWSITGNQHGDPTGALVEKLINSIDALLLQACHESGVDPEGNAAPSSMDAAASRFFDIPSGRLGELTASQQGALAQKIRLVAVGSKSSPSYLVIDEGEGQTPDAFPSTFMSLAKANKLRIPFVQGKFNAGGTGVLPFCGTENYQLIASRRNRFAPIRPDDDTADSWGFTIVRRIRPGVGNNRRNSMYVYLAPDGHVPSFNASSVMVLPRDSRQGPSVPYAEGLEYGTVVKLYEYQWKARSLATTEARFELEKYLHAPCLPFRITETRDYKAHYYSTTFSGIWATIDADLREDERKAVEEGFPASATADLPETGSLPYSIVVFTPERAGRRTPKGIFYTINGQVHGRAPADFVTRRLRYEYLKDALFVSVDCTHMRQDVREDFFMPSRDRVRKNEVSDLVLLELEKGLRDHPGLAALNASRRSRQVKDALEQQEDVVRTFQHLLKLDPSLQSLFGVGDRLVTTVGPTTTEHFEGRRFPTFFRLAHEPKAGLVKHCPVNRSCKVEFNTDAENQYFSRFQSPGALQIEPAALCEYQRLWNGVFSARFRPSDDAKPGDSLEVSVIMSDPDREARGKPPFRNTFRLLFDRPEVHHVKSPGGERKSKQPTASTKEAPRLSMPNIIEVRKKDWALHKMTESDSLVVKRDDRDGYDFYLNLDNPHLLTELTRLASDADRALVRYWFKWGLAISALGLLRHFEKTSKEVAEGDADGRDPVSDVNRASAGLASVIIPVIRTLNRGEQP
ncbi:MAG: hypothetical protein ABSB96_02890 [Gaiellaceae bacterium]